MTELMVLFATAQNYVETYYMEELETVEKFLEINPEDIDKQFFYAQYTHVVYCSGFRWSVVVEKWPRIERAYRNFDAEAVKRNRDQVQAEASLIINHKGKIKAILDTAEWLTNVSPEYLTRFIKDASQNIDMFKRLGYIGDITKYHLGLCMGFDIAKPDVHIQRLADRFNMDPFQMCKQIAGETGLTVRKVDAILWRAAEQGAIRVSSDRGRTEVT